MHNKNVLNDEGESSANEGQELYHQSERRKLVAFMLLLPRKHVVC
jgi:hypothetical protein